MALPTDRIVNERLHNLSLRGTGNLGGNVARQFLNAALSDQYDEEDNPNGCINLGYAENGLMREELLEFANSKPMLQATQLLYGDGESGAIRLRKAVAGFLNERFAPVMPVDWTHLKITTGCTGALDQFAWTVADPGEGIMIGRPLYGGFDNGEWLSSFRVKPVYVAFGDLNPFEVEAVPKYEEALLASERAGVKVRALILCNPHNPLGKCYSLNAIKALLALCQKYQIHLLSDEVYALSKFASDAHGARQHDFISVLSVPLAGLIDPQLVHVCYGMSKDFAANGLRLGVFLTQRNPALLRAISTLGLFAWPAEPGQGLWTRMLADRAWLDWYFAENSRRLAEAYRAGVAWLEARGIEYFKGANYGFFLWCNLRFAFPEGDYTSDLERERALTAKMVAAGVYIATGEDFHAEEHGWYRITFTSHLLELGLQRLDRALYGAAGWQGAAPTVAKPFEETGQTLEEATEMLRVGA